MITLWIHKYLIFISMTSKVIEGQKGHMSFREFEKMNTNIMNTQISHFNKFDLKGHWRSQKVICLSGNLRKFFLTNSFIIWILTLWIRKYWRSQKVTFIFILTLTYVLMDNFLSLFYCRLIKTDEIVSTGCPKNTL